MTSPAIILVQPQLGENIGAAARAMMNFGLSDLRLVRPRDGWPNKKAYDMAAGAAAILDKAQLFDATHEAIADRHHAYATTARGRDMVKPAFAPADLAGQWKSRQADIAFLFGPERTGLTNEDITLCDAIITIPTASEYASLNIAQSVVILAYEWCKSCHPGVVPGSKAHDTLSVIPASPFAKAAADRQGRDDNQAATTSANASPINLHNISPAATRAELQGFFDQLETSLDAADFFKTPQKKPRMWENLRNIFTRSQLTEQEVRTLRGMVRSLREGK